MKEKEGESIDLAEQTREKVVDKKLNDTKRQARKTGDTQMFLQLIIKKQRKRL